MALQKVGVELTADKADAFQRAMQSADTAVSTFGRSATTASNSIGAFEQIAIGGLRRVGEAVTNLAIEGGRQLIGFVGDSLSAAGDFESTLNRFSSVTGDSMQDAGLSLDDFGDKFLELGASTSFSAADAGDAAVALAKGGVDVQTIMGEATEATLNLAAAGELELAPAAEIVAKQLGVWGEESGGATNVVNKLAQAANASTVDVEELALGLANVGGTAKTAGVSFDETVQALALIAPGFSSASDAGTSLKTFFSRLLPTTDNAKEAMYQLGLYTEETGSAFYDAQGNFVGMQQATALLNTATKDLTEEQRLLAFQTIFGQDAIRAAAILSEQGAAGFDAMGASMTNAGTAAEQAAKLNTGYNFAMESLKGSIETVQIVLGTLLLPTLTAFINEAVIPGVNAVLEFATALGASDDPMRMIVAKLGEGAAMLGEWVVSAIPSVIGGLAQLGGALIQWVADQLPAWAAGLAQLGERAALWITESYPAWLQQAGEFFKGMVQWVTDNLPGWGAALLDFGLKAISWIGDQLPALGDELGKFFNRMINWVVDSLPTWVAELEKMAAAAIQWVQDSLPGLGTNLGEFAGKLFGWIAQTTLDVVPKLLELAGKFLAWVVTDVIPELPATLLKIAEGIYNFVATTATDVVPKITEIAKKFWVWITDEAVPAIKEELPKIWDEITGWVSTTATDIWEEVKKIGTAIIDGITQGVKDAAMGLYNAVTGAVSDALGGVADFLGIQSPSTVFRDYIGLNSMRGWIEGIQQGTPALMEAARWAGEATTQTAIGAAESGGLQAGAGFAAQFEAAASGAMGSSVQSALDSALASVVGGAAAQASQGGWLAGSSFASAFQSAIGGIDTGSFISGPSFSGAISGAGGMINPSLPAGMIGGGGQTVNNSSSNSYAVTYNNVATPPPVPQSFATMVALGG